MPFRSPRRTSPLSFRRSKSRQAASLAAAVAARMEPLELRVLFTTIAVTDLGDSGPGTLRDALAASTDGDTIDASGVTGTITLTSGELAVSSSVTITGPGATALSISGNGLSRVFDIAGGKTVSISQLTMMAATSANGGAILTDGNVTLDHAVISGSTAGVAGAAIYENSGSLTILSSTLSNNTAAGAGDASGGAIFASSGSLIIRGSTFSGNTAQPAPVPPGTVSGNIARGGAIYIDSASATITNSTFNGNAAIGGANPDVTGTIGGDGHGGAIYTAGAGSLSLGNVTISGNHAAGGAGANANGAGNGGGIESANPGFLITVQNTIIQGNIADSGPDIEEVGGMSSSGSNIIGDPAGTTGNPFVDGVSGDHVGVNPHLSALANNGGPTFTMAINATSVARDGGASLGAPVTDQRGFSRSGPVDIGAFEFQNHAPSFTSTAVTSANVSQVYTYSITATDADGDAMTITAPTLPAWLTLVDHGGGSATLSGTPAHANVGANSVSLQVSDGIGSATQNFTITVVNHAPVFTSTAPTAATPGQVYTYHVTTTDADGDPMAITAPTLPAWLTLTDNGDGTALLQGTPANSDSGPNNVSLQVSDGLDTNTQAFTITVAARPTLTTISPIGGGIEDTPITITYATLLAQSDASDPNSLPISFQIVAVSSGTLTKNGAPAVAGTLIGSGEAVVWTPAANANGTLAAFTLRASDGTLVSASPVTVSVQVAAVEDPPAGASDSFTISENATASGNVLTNDTHIDGSGLTAILQTQPGSGSVVLNSNGSFTYTPNTDFVGTDGFTYVPNDGIASGNVATVTIHVVKVLKPGQFDFAAAAYQVGAKEGSVVLTINRDGGLDGATSVDYFVSGGSAVSGRDFVLAAGTLQFADQQAAATITVQVPSGAASDGDQTVEISLRNAGGGASIGAASTTTLTIQQIANHPPTAPDIAVTRKPGDNAAIAPLAQATDPDGDPLTLSILTQPANGTASISDNGTPTNPADDFIVYTPNASFDAAESFQYQVTDPRGLSTTGAITINVAGAGMDIDPWNPRVHDLVVVGTPGKDRIVFIDAHKRGVKVVQNGKSLGYFKIGGRLVAYGLGGDDTIIDRNVGRTCYFLGGEGNDHLQGNNASDVLLGGPGNDVLRGINGRDIFIGGSGADTLIGGAQEDILIGGTSIYEADSPASRQALKDLAGAIGNGRLKIEARWLNMQSAKGVGSSHAKLTTATVEDDHAVDLLVGAGRRDWYIGSFNDTPKDRARGRTHLELESII